jgi:hypothetical protein
MPGIVLAERAQTTLMTPGSHEFSDDNLDPGHDKLLAFAAIA